MRVGTFPLADAVGCILIHSVDCSSKKIRKGRVVSEQDVQDLEQAGHTSVFAARLDENDVHEDLAAGQISAPLAGPFTAVRDVGTGRCNIHAQSAGVLTLDAEHIHQLNRIHEGLTVATLLPDETVGKDQLIATVKIIPYSIPKTAVIKALKLLEDTAALSVAPFAEKRVALISTKVEGTKRSVIEKTLDITRSRVNSLGGVLTAHREADHSADAIKDAARTCLEAGPDILLISGASAIADREDVVPSAITELGGHVIHYGMPVDPGNLLLLAELEGVPVVGLPGCARSPKLNGADWVLARLHANLPIVPDDIMTLGVGGLLKEIPIRPSPREGHHRIPEEKPKRVAALVLAAGQSRRMGRENKLLAKVNGKAMVRHVVEGVLSSQANSVTVVLGHESEAVKKALAGLDLEFVLNPDFAEGLSTSLLCGLSNLSGDIDAVLVCLGDMPFVSAPTIDALISKFDPAQDGKICVPTFEGKRGNPVLWAAEFIPEMLEAAGDTGAKHLIGQYRDFVRDVPMDDIAVLTDIDTPEALDKVRRE